MSRDKRREGKSFLMRNLFLYCGNISCEKTMNLRLSNQGPSGQQLSRESKGTVTVIAKPSKRFWPMKGSPFKTPSVVTVNSSFHNAVQGQLDTSG